MYSGGIGSWAAAKRVAELHGTDDLILLFSDTMTEDEDLYRFIEDSHKNVGGELVILRDGRNIWDVFKDKRFLGNSRLASCSHELKQKPARKWIDDNCDPAETIVYVGIDWTETHRLGAIERNYQPFAAKAPLCERPYLDKNQLIEWAKREDLAPPRLYDLGFSHNNCGGFCVRAGQAQMKQLMKTFPERFDYHAQKEQELREYLGKDVTILREQVNKEILRLPLIELKRRVEAEQAIDEDDWGACGCFLDDTNTEDSTE
jgi:hypothetical protein